MAEVEQLAPPMLVLRFLQEELQYNLDLLVNHWLVEEKNDGEGANEQAFTAMVEEDRNFVDQQ